MTPSAQPPTEIFDPSDKKPVDWDEEEYIDDETATKPDGLYSCFTLIEALNIFIV
jgi:hypothetical protein